MANDESPKTEPTLTSISDAPALAPSAEPSAPAAATPAASTAEAPKAEAPKPEARPAAPKAEDILAEVARANSKNAAILKPDSRLPEPAKATPRHRRRKAMPPTRRGRAPGPVRPTPHRTIRP